MRPTDRATPHTFAAFARGPRRSFDRLIMREFGAGQMRRDAMTPDVHRGFAPGSSPLACG
ncbi:hypothetical protein A8F72_08855 [Burkholderia cenocepacia]|nr:hypothetical protein TQ36_21280 [Burkholderia cenocepacia]AQQ45572.1 hypothetical protein A8F32_06630 [Burkholderia cenocepacia]ONI95868.1 hypothetical protein A8F33_26565 [Burkholderia cenocepacia]ONJ00382.1 hypothetical protein A8F53_09750 [Burkholderia cenocepacia]ONJ33001.1 hypothetical protein A8F38_02215 [Burkholderia cenocepacia]